MWWTKRALGLHVTVAVLLPIFGGLAYWQVSRALAGNTLSWVYSVEWPFFAFYAVFLWWKLVHEEADADSAGTTSLGSLPRHAPRPDDEIRLTEEAAAYNRYLASLYPPDGRDKRRDQPTAGSRE